jgi:hypothetical protein
LTHGRTPAERETALRLAVEQWAGRHLAASTISSKLRTHIRRVRKDAKFLIEIEALDRHLAGFDKPLPTTNIHVPPDSGIAGMLQDIRAHWVATAVDIISSRGMREISEGIKERTKFYLPPHRGSQRLTDALGAPKGRELCAVAVTDVYAAWRGWKPAHHNPDAQRLCAIIWRMAGRGVLSSRKGTKTGQKGTKDSDAGWEDPLRLAWAHSRFYTYLESRLRISHILHRNGCRPSAS